MMSNLAETVSQGIYHEFIQQLTADPAAPFLTLERLTEIAKIKGVDRDIRFQQMLRHDLELPGGKFSAGRGGILEELNPEIVRESAWPVLAEITQQALAGAFSELRQIEDAGEEKLSFLSRPVLGVLALVGADLLRDERFSPMVQHDLEITGSGFWGLLPAVG